MDEYYIFTFGSDHALAGKAIKIKGSFMASRLRMIEEFGTKWAFQYSEKEWEDLENDPNRFWPMEEIIKVIE